MSLHKHSGMLWLLGGAVVVSYLMNKNKKTVVTPTDKSAERAVKQGYTYTPEADTLKAPAGFNLVGENGKII